MALTAKQVVRRWGNSLGVCLPAAIVREAHLLEDQPEQLTVVEEGIRSAQKWWNDRAAQVCRLGAGAWRGDLD